MKIGDLAGRTGMSAHTIRYYEKIGLLPRVARGRSRQREYDASILPWIDFLGRLKTTGMPIRDMVRYAALRAEGTATEGARRELLVRHRAELHAHVAELHACLSVLDAKIAGYAGSSRMEEHHEADEHDSGAARRRKSLRTRLAGAV